IFDLGGVLFDIEYNLTAHAFRKLGINDFDRIYSQARQDGIFDDFETGHSSPSEFRTRLRQWLKPDITDEAIDSAWNAMLLGMKPDKLELLQSLQGKYKLFLLSNTNEIHLPAVFRMMQQSFGFPDLGGFMNKQYFSCRLGMRKPNAEIFNLVLQEQQLDPYTTLFIDDSIQHIEGAARLGIQTHHLVMGESLQGMLRQKGIL
ncbi:MAG TPA: HAD family phosphatase, partial [Bacteroidia bacterium]|nr:HAD family phosphatase [Bacteroidia bacterium]